MSEPVSASPPRVFLLGRFEVRLGEQVVIDRAWSRRKAKALVKLLALQRGHALHREQVLDALWPELDPSAAANQLHKNLYYLRTVLADCDLREAFVSVAADMVALPAEVWVDTDAFRAQVQAARASRGDPRPYEEALALYAGDLLPEDLYEDWAEPTREELRRLRIELLAELSESHERAGQVEPAARTLEEVLQSDPVHEEAHRRLMRLYASTGSRHRALRQYQACKSALERELGVEPSPETEALHRELLEGRFAADGRTGEGGDGAKNVLPTTAPAPPRPLPASPLYGRERELEEAEELLEAALAGQGRALFVGGVAGIGKSRFVQQVLAAAEERGALALVGRSYELEATVAYQPVRDVLRQVLERAPGAGIPQMVQRSLHLRRLLPEAEAEFRPAADPALLQVELFGEVARVFEALARETQGVVICFDDLHAADDASLRLVHFLCRQLARQPILLLATYRAEEAAPGGVLAPLLGSLKRERLAREIVLGPLDDRAMRLLIEQLFEGQTVDRELLRELAGQAEGNALFAQELVRTLIENGSVRLVDGRWRRRATGVAPVPAPVPAAVQDLLDRRLQHLGDQARQVLHTASVLGRNFDYGLLRRAVQLPEQALLDGLDQCIATYVVEETSDGYRFRHGLLREGVYRRLTRARRQQLHRAVAVGLSEDVAGREADAEVVGHHFLQSDEPWRAVPYLQTAAQRAAAVFANEQAMRLYEQAATILREQSARAEPKQLASVLEAWGDLKSRTGDVDGSVALFEEALMLLASAGEHEAALRARGKAALTHISRGDVQAATEHMSATLQGMTDRSPKNVVSRTYYLLAQLHWHKAQHQEALEAAEQALRAAESSGDENQKARALEVMALACHSLGDWQKGVEYELSRQSLGVAGFDTDEAFDAHL